MVFPTQRAPRPALRRDLGLTGAAGHQPGAGSARGAAYAKGFRAGDTPDRTAQARSQTRYTRAERWPSPVIGCERRRTHGRRRQRRSRSRTPWRRLEQNVVFSRRSRAMSSVFFNASSSTCRERHLCVGLSEGSEAQRFGVMIRLKFAASRTYTVPQTSACVRISSRRSPRHPRRLRLWIAAALLATERGGRHCAAPRPGCLRRSA